MNGSRRAAALPAAPVAPISRPRSFLSCQLLMNVARSIIQEKTSRIFEVMLATAKPGDLLAGKLIGVGAVGLTQIGIWVVLGAGLATTALAGPIMSGQLAVHFSWVEGILFPVYFVLGYLLYASLFAGLAASCETEQELQMYTPLAALPIWLSFSLIWLVINDPNSVWSIAASLFPATAPIVAIGPSLVLVRQSNGTWKDPPNADRERLLEVGQLGPKITRPAKCDAAGWRWFGRSTGAFFCHDRRTFIVDGGTVTAKGKMPERCEEMKKRIDRWEADVSPPLYKQSGKQVGP